MDDLSVKIRYSLDGNSSTEVIQKTKKLEEDLQKTPIQLRIEANTGIASQEMSKSAKNYEQVWEKAFYNQRVMALKTADDIKNAYNTQYFDNFNKSIGIGTTNNNSARESALAFQPIFDEEDKAIQISKAKNKQFWDTFNQSVGIGTTNSNSARQASSAFNTIFAEEDKAIITQKSKMQQFWKEFDQSVGIGTTSNNSAKASAAVFEELFNKANKTTAGLSSVEKQIVSLNPQLKTMSQGMDMSSQSISGMILKFGEWYIIGGLVSGLFNELGKSVKFVDDLNKSMTNISMVTGLSHDKVTQMTQDYVNLALQLHDTVLNVSKASEEFLRAGHTQDETLALLKSSTVMSKISGEDQKATADQLIAITNAYGIEAGKTMEVVDKLTTVDNNSATSTKELGQALERTSSSAQMAGVNFDQLVSYIATISSVTRKSATSIGESFNFRGLVA